MHESCHYPIKKIWARHFEHNYATNLIKLNGYNKSGYIDRENLLSFYLGYLDLIYWSVHSYSLKGGEGPKKVDILAS